MQRRFRYFAVRGKDKRSRVFEGTEAEAREVAKSWAFTHRSPVALFGELELGGEESLGTISPANDSDVIVKNITMLSHATPATYNQVKEAVKALASENEWTVREAAAVVAQSFGLVVRFS
jgi:hypothetical protein